MLDDVIAERKPARSRPAHRAPVQRIARIVVVACRALMVWDFGSTFEAASMASSWAVRCLR